MDENTQEIAIQGHAPKGKTCEICKKKAAKLIVKGIKNAEGKEIATCTSCMWN